MCWSGGKDSALALRLLNRSRDYDVRALLTTLTAPYQRISMHGVRRELLSLQAESLDLSLVEVWIGEGASNAEYEEQMAEALWLQRRKGVEQVAFGDIFLEDIRSYREAQLARLGMRAVFPLWQRDTAALAREFLAQGFRGIVSVVDTDVLDERWAGRHLDEQFFAELPAGIDPCGENGEFHSFVFDGPDFAKPIPCFAGRSHRDGRFYFCDLTTAPTPPP